MIWAEKGGVIVDHKLKQDLEHFFSVYQGRVNDNLRSGLRSDVARLIGQMLDSELSLFHESVMNRLEEYFRIGF